MVNVLFEYNRNRLSTNGSKCKCFPELLYFVGGVWISGAYTQSPFEQSAQPFVIYFLTGDINSL
jgi:hypothetical protein